MGIKGFQPGHSTSLSTKIKIGNANRNQIFFFCDYCGKLSHSCPSNYKQKTLHFCNQRCYSEYRKYQMPYSEQHAYKGVRKPGESKQVYHRNYCKKHPQNIAHLKARRYAREKGATGKHTLREWQELKEESGGHCVFCWTIKPLTKDHIIPLSEGGTDYIDNIQPLCRNCNSRKWKHIYENPELVDK